MEDLLQFHLGYTMIVLEGRHLPMFYPQTKDI